MANNTNGILTREDVLDIYERAHSGESQTEIAKDYAVSQATVSGIKLGSYHNETTGHARNRRLTPRQERMLDIYSAYWDDKLPVKEIAEKFGVSQGAVYDIRNGSTGRQITGHPRPKIRPSRQLHVDKLTQLKAYPMRCRVGDKRRVVGE